MGTRRKITYMGRMRVVESIDEDGKTINPDDDPADGSESEDSESEDSESVFD